MHNPNILRSGNIESGLEIAIESIKVLEVPDFDVRKGQHPDLRQIITIPQISVANFNTASSAILRHMQSGKITPDNRLTFTGKLRIQNPRLSMETLQHWAPYFKSLGADFWSLVDNFPKITPDVNNEVEIAYESPIDHERRHLEKIATFGKTTDLDLVLRPNKDGRTVSLAGWRILPDKLDLPDEAKIDIGLAPNFPDPSDIRGVVSIAVRSGQQEKTLGKIFQKFAQIGVPLMSIQVQPPVDA